MKHITSISILILCYALLPIIPTFGQHFSKQDQSSLKQSYLFHEYTTYGNYSLPVLPFLLEDANARIAGFGSVSSVANPFYTEAGSDFNPALLSRRKKTIGVDYTNSGQKDNDFLKSNFAAFQYSINKKNALALQIRHLNYKDIVFYNIYGSVTSDYKPKAYSIKLSYAHHWMSGLSAGSALKYIFSTFRYYYANSNGYTPSDNEVNTIALDLGINYDKVFLETEKSELSYSLAASLNNLGPKISMVEEFDKDFLPAQLSIGAMLSDAIKLSETAKICFDVAYEIDKSLVPTPPIYAENPDTYETYIYKGKDTNISALRSYFQSFYDAPDGFKEEMQELIHQLGVEGRVHGKNFIMAFRFGMFRQHKEKGDLRYNTLGLGANFKGAYINYSIHYDTNRGIFKGNEMEYVKYLQVGYNYQF